MSITRWFLRKDRAFAGLTGYSSYGCAAAQINPHEPSPLFPRSLSPAPGAGLCQRHYFAVGATSDIFMGTWVSPALKDGSYSSLTFTFNIAGAEGTLASNAKFKHFIYLLRGGVYHSTIVSASVDGTELPVLPNSTLTQDQSYDIANADSRWPVGKTSATQYACQGFTSGAGSDGWPARRARVWMWRSGEPYDYIQASLRDARTGADLCTKEIHPRYISNEATGTATVDQVQPTINVAVVLDSKADWAGQSFIPSVAAPIPQAVIYLTKVGSPTGKAVAHLRRTDTGKILATASIDVSTIVAGSWNPYTFTFDRKIWLTTSTSYYLQIHVVGALDASNYVSIGAYSGSGYANGQLNTSTDYGQTWASAGAGYDMRFETYYLASLSLTYTPVDFEFDEPPLYAGSTQYYLLLTREGAADNEEFVYLAADTSGAYSGANNFASYSADGFSWTDVPTYDLCFVTYYSGKDAYVKTQGRTHSVSGVSFSAQRGDHIVYECLVECASGGSGIMLAYDGPETIEDETTVLQQPASYVEINTEIATLWDDLIDSTGVEVHPILNIETYPPLSYSIGPITNVSAPPDGGLREISGLTRSLGDDMGNYTISDMTARIADSDGTLKRLLAAPPGSQAFDVNVPSIRGARASVTLLLKQGEIIDWRRVYSGWVDNYNRNIGPDISFSIKSKGLPEYPAPKDTISAVDWPAAPSDSLGHVTPVFMGGTVGPVPGLLVDSNIHRYLLCVGNAYVSDVTLAGVEAIEDNDYWVEVLDGLPYYGGCVTCLCWAHDCGSSQVTCKVSNVQFRLVPLEGLVTDDPITNMRTFLVGFAGIESSRLNELRIARYADYATRRGITMGGGIRTQSSVAAVIQQWVESFDVEWFWDRDGLLAPASCEFAAGGTPKMRLEGVEFKFDESGGSNQCQRVQLDYDYDHAAGAYQSSLEDRDEIETDPWSQEPTGELLTSETLGAIWISDGASGLSRLTSHARKHESPRPLALVGKARMKAFSLEPGDLVVVNHPAGEGHGYHDLECQLRTIGYQFGPDVELTLAINDIFDAAILGDEDDGAATWSDASDADRRYCYLCDDATKKYVDGTYGKGLCSNPTLEGNMLPDLALEAKLSYQHMNALRDRASVGDLKFWGAALTSAGTSYGSHLETTLPLDSVAEDVVAFFEGNMKAGASGTIYAQIYNVTDSIAVSGSEISSTNSSAYECQRTAAEVTLLKDKVYVIQTKHATAAGNVALPRLVFL